MKVSYEKRFKKNVFDVDYYFIELHSGLSNKEYNIYVDFFDKTITGDVVRYGSWDDLSENECIEILEIVKKAKKIKRDYSKIV